MNKKANAGAGLLLIVIVATLFISYYVTIPVHGKLYHMFTDDDRYSEYISENDCIMHGGVWEDMQCKALDDRTHTSVDFMRKMWLTIPFIFVIGLIIWLISVATRRDPQEYYLR
jgi:hypothetical protein